MAVVANYTDQAAHPGGRHVGQPPTHAESPRGDSCRAARLQVVHGGLQIGDEALIR